MAEEDYNIRLTPNEMDIIVRVLHWHCSNVVDEPAMDLLRELQDTQAFHSYHVSV